MGRRKGALLLVGEPATMKAFRSRQLLLVENMLTRALPRVVVIPSDVKSNRPAKPAGRAPAPKLKPAPKRQALVASAPSAAAKSVMPARTLKGAAPKRPPQEAAAAAAAAAAAGVAAGAASAAAAGAGGDKAASDRPRPVAIVQARLGLGRIAVSEGEVPNLCANLVWSG